MPVESPVAGSETTSLAPSGISISNLHSDVSGELARKSYISLPSAPKTARCRILGDAARATQPPGAPEDSKTGADGLSSEMKSAAVLTLGFQRNTWVFSVPADVHFLRKNNAKFIAANPDWVCPMPNDEVLPDCGSICALITASSGVEPMYIGKPNRNMVDVISKMTGIPNEKICCVGDRLYTDIAVAQNAEAVSLLVLSGETDMAMVEAAERKPDYILDGVWQIADLLK